jgi:hypothetical protein
MGCLIDGGQKRMASLVEKTTRRFPHIELLLLGTLRYLGMGWSFNDIEEGTKVSWEVHRCFLHAFTTFGAKIFVPALRANAADYRRLAKLRVRVCRGRLSWMYRQYRCNTHTIGQGHCFISASAHRVQVGFGDND